MGKITSCSIALRAGKVVYRDGDLVSGFVTLEVSEAVKVKGVRVYCYGEALTKWTKTVSRDNIDLIGSEKYLSGLITVFGRKLYEDGPNPTLTPGQHKYDFAFRLPDSLPSSFEGPWGAIRYFLKVVVDKPFPSVNNEWFRAFTVLSCLNLNLNAYKEPQTRCKTTTVSKALGLGDAGPLTLTVHTDRLGYCSGESILVTVEAKNDSTKDLGQVRTGLELDVVYTANDETQRDETLMSCTETQEILAKGTTMTIKDMVLPIPAIPPSTRKGTCHIIKCAYYVKVTVHVPWSRNVDVFVPIIIGTIPRGKKVLPPRRAGQPVAATTAATNIEYKRCQAGIYTCKKSNNNFPNFPYTPFTAFVSHYDPARSAAQEAAVAAAAASARSTGASAPLAQKARQGLQPTQQPNLRPSAPSAQQLRPSAPTTAQQPRSPNASSSPRHPPPTAEQLRDLRQHLDKTNRLVSQLEKMSLQQPPPVVVVPSSGTAPALQPPAYSPSRPSGVEGPAGECVLPPAYEDVLRDTEQERRQAASDGASPAAAATAVAETAKGPHVEKPKTEASNVPKGKKCHLILVRFPDALVDSFRDCIRREQNNLSDSEDAFVAALSPMPITGLQAPNEDWPERVAVALLVFPDEASGEDWLKGVAERGDTWYSLCDAVSLPGNWTIPKENAGRLVFSVVTTRIKEPKKRAERLEVFKKDLFPIITKLMQEAGRVSQGATGKSKALRGQWVTSDDTTLSVSHWPTMTGYFNFAAKGADMRAKSDATGQLWNEFMSLHVTRSVLLLSEDLSALSTQPTLVNEVENDDHADDKEDTGDDDDRVENLLPAYERHLSTTAGDSD